MKFRKKPVVIEAHKFTGKSSYDKMCAAWPTFYTTASFHCVTKRFIKIHTLEGYTNASIGDFVIKGVRGEFYSCNCGVFKETYEAVEETHNGPRKNS